MTINMVYKSGDERGAITFVLQIDAQESKVYGTASVKYAETVPMSDEDFRDYCTSSFKQEDLEGRLHGVHPDISVDHIRRLW